jgi:2-methylcitrate dehydratase
MSNAAYPGSDTAVVLAADSNQALGIGQFAVDFLAGKLGPGPDQEVLERTQLFHTDAVLCGTSALALGTNAPTILAQEALSYPDSDGATILGSNVRCKPEKAVAAASSAVREWDSNGTNFGFRPEFSHTAGEFGHNDFYPVVIAACQQQGFDGKTALKAMVCQDEIRGRLAEVFSLKTYKIDHVVHGGIASAAVYGALMGASAEQIECAIGMVVAHAIPWRAIRAGKQLSDSKGASAAITTEFAVLSMKRAMAGFIGPKDIFRNPEAVFRFLEPTTEGDARWSESGDSPFDLVLSHSGSDFAVMGMHFKLGLYEHQSAGALQGVIDLLKGNPDLAAKGAASVDKITILAYEPAFGIIGNPMKMDPQTRQSADHSMAFIVSSLLRKAFHKEELEPGFFNRVESTDEIWKALMLSPYDYHQDRIFDDGIRSLMGKISFKHGGPEYDAKYPDGIPTSLVISSGGAEFDSGFIMYPAGHARNSTADLRGILDHKFRMMSLLSVPEGHDPALLVNRLQRLPELDTGELMSLYEFELAVVPDYE